MSAVDTVQAEVRELVRRGGLDPFEDRAAVGRLVDEVISDYDGRVLTSALAPLADSRTAARAVFDAVAGFGPLQRHLDDDTVEEIWINRANAWVGGRAMRSRRRLAGSSGRLLTGRADRVGDLKAVTTDIDASVTHELARVTQTLT